MKKCVLVTGATGAIGSALVPLFLDDKDTKVVLLLRAESSGHLRRRLESLFAFWGAQCLALGQIEALRGDVCLSRLGLDGRDYSRLAAEVTHVVHAAGNVKLNQSLEEARRHTVGALKEVLSFVKTCQSSGQFFKLEYVSTIGVAGRMSGTVLEEPFPMPRQPDKFHNTYEAAKAEAEDLLLQQMRAGIPGTVYRPSMVVGDSRTGQIMHFQVFYHLTEFLSGMKTYGIVPDPGNVRLDLIPVDYVTRAICIASDRQEAIGRIFHLCSGPQFSWSLRQMCQELRTIYMDYGHRLFRLRPVPKYLFSTVIPSVAWCLPKKLRRAFATLPFFLSYLDTEQAFDNAETQQFFKPPGLNIPAVEEYLRKVMDYYLQPKRHWNLPY